MVRVPGLYPVSSGFESLAPYQNANWGRFCELLNWRQSIFPCTAEQSEEMLRERNLLRWQVVVPNDKCDEFI